MMPLTIRGLSLKIGCLRKKAYTPSFIFIYNLEKYVVLPKES